MTADDIIFYFVMLHKGNWNAIYDSIRRKEKIDEDKLEEFRRQNNSPYITLLSDDYPESLKRINKPPYLLFYKGDLSLLKNERIIAAVGTRRMSSYGKLMAKRFIPGLVKKKYVIVSGLAKGIDAEVHRLTLNGGGKTIGVIANGLDICYPQCNADIYDGIGKNGLIITEFPNGVNAEPLSFQGRNRLISGLAKGVLVIEAYQRSGTLITVRHAIEQGKEIYCVPDRLNTGSICNHLIKEFACLVEDPNDIEVGF